MKKYTVKFTKKAREELDTIGDYIAFALNEPKTALEILERIYRKCDKLIILPKGTPVKEKIGEIEFRFSHCGNYTIVYSIDEKELEVTIRNIIYSKRNIAAILEKQN